MYRCLLIAGWGLAAAVLVGCNPAKDAFDKVSLGQPLSSAAMPHESTRSRMGYVWSRVDQWALPVAVSAMRIRLMGHDACSAKVYRKDDMIFLGLDLFIQRQEIIEVEVPPTAFHIREINESEADTMKSAMVVFRILSPFVNNIDSTSQPTTQQENDTGNFPADTADISKFMSRILDRIHAELTSQPESETEEDIIKSLCDNVIGFIFLVKMIDCLLPDESIDPIDAFGSEWLFGATLQNFDSGAIPVLLRHRQSLKDITRTGFDWRVKDDSGATIHAQNLGGRRIRIEIVSRFSTFGKFPLIRSLFEKTPDEPTTIPDEIMKKLEDDESSGATDATPR